MSDARIFVAIATYNRRAVAEQCIPTVSRGMNRPDDRLFLYDDGSTEYNAGPIDVGQDYSIRTESMGIDAQRLRHFKDFWYHAHRPHCGVGPAFTHLYLCDSDSPHDPEWRTHALALQEKYSAPICLYRTQTHADYFNNIYHDDPSEDVIWQRFSPGVSLLLNIEMVGRIMSRIPDKWAWDWAVPGLLGYRMAISRVSYCDHIGRAGLHDPEDGSIGPERALNPTPWLREKREEVINSLTNANS